VTLPDLTSSRLTWGLLAGSSMALALLLLLGQTLQPLARRRPSHPMNVHLARVLAALALVRRQPGALAGASIIYVVHHLLVVLAVYLGALALGLSIPLPWMLALVPLGRVLVLLPVSVSGLGVQEAAFVALFAQVGLPAPAAFSISVLCHLALLVVPAAGGLVFLWGQGRTGDRNSSPGGPETALAQRAK
jgi:uncharacterized membrane protein YbhN (UPF0104 family)